MKILILGGVASGKTTLARRLAAVLSLPAIEGDCIAHDDGAQPRRKRTPQEQQAQIDEIDRRGSWLIEGVYRPDQHCLLELADFVVLLDTPFATRLRRVLTRFVRQQLGLESCHYRSDWAMLRRMFCWAVGGERDKPQRDEQLAPYRHKLCVVRTSGPRGQRMILNHLQSIRNT